MRNLKLPASSISALALIATILGARPALAHCSLPAPVIVNCSNATVTLSAVTDFGGTFTAQWFVDSVLAETDVLTFPSTGGTLTFTHTYPIGTHTVLLELTQPCCMVSCSTTVTVNSCSGGCTATIGFWKTHAGFTGNNPDLVTPLLPVWLGTWGGPDTVTVSTAAQAVFLLSDSGDASNGINRLYAQLLGAKLNLASGADGSAVALTISLADTFLATHSAADWSSLTSQQQGMVEGWQNTLDEYNEGLIGPGHCSD